MSKELERKRIRLERRKHRTRSQIKGTNMVPRLCVVKSNRYIYCQLIDDVAGKALFGIHSKSIDKSTSTVVSSEKLGEAVGAQALEKGIKKIVFDRGASRYTGRVKAVAEGARKAGLKF
jgi:large subunit ribosomal protein L18